MNEGRSNPVIGLVGGIGAGKSTVACGFAQLGCAVINADAIAQSLLDEPEVFDELVKWWGRDVIALGGPRRIHRPTVSKIVFGDPVQLARLEKLLHPRVIAERGRLLDLYRHDPTKKAVIDDTPLLMEKELDKDCDFIVLIEADTETRRKRVMENRRWPAKELDKRQALQLALDTKARRADYCVVNDADEAHCLVQVSKVLNQILAKYQGPERGAFPG